MSFAGLSFLSPFVLLGLLVLPVIWWLLRSTPPRPTQQAFPPTKILKDLINKKTTPAHSPWWLTLLRLLLAGLVILALARPVYNQAPQLMSTTPDKGPLILLVDNGWSAADQWSLRLSLMKRLISEAHEQNRSVYIVPTVNPDGKNDLMPLAADKAQSVTEQLLPSALTGDRLQAIERIDSLVKAAPQGSFDGGVLFWLSDGLGFADKAKLIDKLNGLTQLGLQVAVARPDAKQQPFGLAARLGQGGALYALIEGIPGDTPRTGEVLALSQRDEVLGKAPYVLAAGTARQEVKIELPVELRNQIVKLKLEGVRSAGAVHLLDQRSEWRRIGLVSNESGVLAQPLLSPLYYINRALEPFAEIVRKDEGDAGQAIEQLTARNVSVIMMADVGLLFGAPLLRLSEWVEKGGVLVRFAGPHMEKSQDSLLPTPLRSGGRRLGGALSWSKPQHLAEFDKQSPFAGLTVPDEVVVTRQLLADPAQLTDDVFIWARLKDGTPLVTAKREVEGWVVLVHVTANSEWSNLPLSGLFVEMLKRLTHLSAGTVGSNDQGKSQGGQSEVTSDIATEAGLLLPPSHLLDGFGQLRAPSPTVLPLLFHQLKDIRPSLQHPPGFYGPAGQSVALNVFPAAGPLQPLSVPSGALSVFSYQDDQSVSLRGPLFLTAFLLLLLDGLVVLWMRGVLSLPHFARTEKAAILLFVCFAFIALPSVAWAQETEPAVPSFQAALNTHLAYVTTGVADVDKASKQGLHGLSAVLKQRTAVEPKAPRGVNILRDELSFYPLLYWPVGPYTPPLSDKAAQRVNAYMKHGGMIIFDTKDQNSRIGGLEGTGQKVLQKLLAKLDIPRLEPVPQGHVLTKSFYLLSQFPGKFQDGALWVEAHPKQAPQRERKTSEIDGVSTILVTSNDFASAWAVDANRRPLYPVVPGGQLQREMAYRVGVNIVMYALAGNYKADQVHVPALLERLGQ